MIRKTLLLMSFLSLFGCGASHAPEFPTDTFTARDGSQFTMTFIKHGSLAIEVAGKHIYIDPVSEYADYATLPKADLILVTHSHYDHFDRTAIEALETPETDLLCDKTTAEAFDFDCHVMMPGDTARPRNYVTIEAVAAYNTSADRQQYHPRERQDVGYLLTIGGTRIYVSGDGELLAVNQPFTMTVDQAVEAVKAIRPKIFYPYHYGEVDEKTDLDRLTRELEGVTEVRIRPME